MVPRAPSQGPRDRAARRPQRTVPAGTWSTPRSVTSRPSRPSGPQSQDHGRHSRQDCVGHSIVPLAASGPPRRGSGPRHPRCPQVAGSPLPSRPVQAPACTPAPSQRLPTPSWLPRLCPGGSGLQMDSRVGGCLLPPRPLQVLGGHSEGGAASGGPLRTRVPDTPLLEPSLSAHCALPTGSRTNAAPTAQRWARCRPAPRLAAPDRCPPPIQLLPSPSPFAVSTPPSSIRFSAGWSAGQVRLQVWDREGAPVPPGLRGPREGEDIQAWGHQGVDSPTLPRGAQPYGHLCPATLRLPGKCPASASQAPGGVQHRPWGRCSRHNKGCL